MTLRESARSFLVKHGPRFLKPSIEAWELDELAEALAALVAYHAHDVAARQREACAALVASKGGPDFPTPYPKIAEAILSVEVVTLDP